MDETHAERLLEELLDRGLVPDERIEEVERLRDAGEIWVALEYALKGEISDPWRPAVEIV
ncbi:hypothetical protein GRX01_13410 [Halobaculum sp. WSA2]|uniref:Uncharacterized protein n=1 Tax=Halobaculum saliterrae TaxID=2073113 RepID=A0A6B0T0Y8_9EURY|nr:hypothetical protein [Halobaculum saliterrae]MXR42331.1 hypothetical protein [Halobaculum saliterrae]